MIEIGRYQNKKDEITGKWRKMLVNERTCPVCKSGEVENEFHFIMVCNTYVIPRNFLFQKQIYCFLSLVIWQLMSNSHTYSENKVSWLVTLLWMHGTSEEISCIKIINT